jgi:predicted polyphosphate/ATP-dependent NAD kinase
MKLGLIVNPIAGMGGKVGLKGTDNVLKEAIARGAEPVAPKRALEFLQKLCLIMDNIDLEILTCPGAMGEDEVKTVGFRLHTLPMAISKQTSAKDTKTAVLLMAKAKTDLIVFVGGDGTARDLLDSMDENRHVPVLGVPSGVKMYSGIFAVNPADAADVVMAFAEKKAEITEFEIMDVDERAIRKDVFAVKLYGLMKGPLIPDHMQGSKEVSPDTLDEKDNQNAIAKFIIEQMHPDATYILGPGTTLERLAEHLGVKKTILGVDIYSKGKVKMDVDENEILESIEQWNNTWIVLSPIGHQGILLGRGNQQISPRIIKRVGKERIIVAATKTKLRDIEGKTLRIDTGDAETDKLLGGYIRVFTDYREWRLVRLQ